MLACSLGRLGAARLDERREGEERRRRRERRPQRVAILGVRRDAAAAAVVFDRGVREVELVGLVLAAVRVVAGGGGVELREAERADLAARDELKLLYVL